MGLKQLKKSVNLQLLSTGKIMFSSTSSVSIIVSRLVGTVCFFYNYLLKKSFLTHFTGE
jgi:hypothetical protein